MSFTTNSVRSPFRPGETRTVALIGSAHAFSHFYMLALPPIFPLLNDSLDVSYAALGTLLMLYAIATGVMQVPMGVLVDRIGGRLVLAFGLALNAAAIFLVGFVPTYWAMALFMVIAGAGNSVFHPADYAILSARIGEGRIGRAFGVHLFAGYIGWMLAPPIVLTLTSISSWEIAMMTIGVVGLVFSGALALSRRSLSDEQVREDAKKSNYHARMNGERTGMRLLFTPVIMALFLFYMIVAAAGNGIQSFSVVALVELHGISLTRANLLLTVFFVAAATGTLFGGYFADRIRHRERATAIAYALTALFVAIVGLQAVPIFAISLLMLLTGVTFAAVGPMRDILVRNAAPIGQTATTFGVVTTGFSIGLAVSPIIFGWVADIGRPEFIFWATSAKLGLAVLALYILRANPANAGRFDSKNDVA